MATIASLNVDFTANTAQFMKAADNVSRRATSIDKEMKKMSETMGMLRGGAALGGLMQITKTLGDTFEALPGIMRELEDGTIRWSTALGKVAEQIPLIASGMKAGRSIGTVIGDWWQGDRMRSVERDAAMGAANRAAAEAERAAKAIDVAAMNEMATLAGEIDKRMRQMWPEFDAGIERSREQMESLIARIEAARQADPNAAGRAADYERLIAQAREFHDLEAGRINSRKAEEQWAARIAQEQEERNRLIDEGRRLQEQYATPLEKQIAFLERIDGLLEQGVIDMDTFLRAQADAESWMDRPSASSAPEVAALERMSVAGLTQRDFAGSDPQKAIEKNTRDQLAETRRMRQGIDELKTKAEPVEVRGI